MNPTPFCQEAALDRISQRCQRQARVRRTKHVCLLCERAGRRGKPRLCSRTFRVVCQACDDSASSIPAIDMLGRIVTVQGRQLILAPCCATVQEYAGTGTDLAIRQEYAGTGTDLAIRQEYAGTGSSSTSGMDEHETCIHSAQAPPHQNSQGGRKARVTCSVCDSQALPRAHEVLDHLAARMTSVHLCHRHTPPEEWIRRCANLRQFELACREWERKVRANHKRG